MRSAWRQWCSGRNSFPSWRRWRAPLLPWLKERMVAFYICTTHLSQAVRPPAPHVFWNASLFHVFVPTEALLDCDDLHSVIRLVLKAGNYMNSVGVLLTEMLFILSEALYFCPWAHVHVWFRVATPQTPSASGWPHFSSWRTPKPTSLAWTSCTTLPRWAGAIAWLGRSVILPWRAFTHPSRRRRLMQRCWHFPASSNTSEQRRGGGRQRTLCLFKVASDVMLTL